jgi:hypothetical protein
MKLEGDVEQRQLFESNVVSFGEFRQRRETAPADRDTSRPVLIEHRPVSQRSIAHQARMLAHLETLTNVARR